MVIPENERKALKPDDRIGSFWDADDGRLVYFPEGQYKEDISDLPELDELPDSGIFLGMINTDSFILSERLSKLFRDVMADLEKEAEENERVDSAE